MVKREKSCLGNKKFKSVSKPLYGITVDPNSNNGFNRGCSTTNQKTKECRPTQIDIEEKWEQEKITPRKQEIQECVQTNIWGNYGSQYQH